MKSAIHSFNLLFPIFFHFFRCYKVTLFRQLILFWFLLSEMNIFQREIDIIRKLLNRKVASNRGGQKMVRHTLRTVFNFNISDFNVQGQPFGPKELDECVRRNRIHILDEATIEEMKQRYAEQKPEQYELSEESYFIAAEEMEEYGE